MAWGNSKRGGDRVLESRHLVGLFLGVVLLCSVFFTLGYEMARTQYGGPVHAADSFVRPAPAPVTATKPKDSDAAPPPATGEWDLYSKNDDTHLEPAPKPSSPAAVPASGEGTSRADSPTPRTVSEPVSKPPARYAPPRMLKGSVVLQLAALRREGDALAMADAVQQKRFPAFVVTPASDNLYRVQVGPYRDERAAETAQAELARAGFKAIIKR